MDSPTFAKAANCMTASKLPSWKDWRRSSASARSPSIKRAVSGTEPRWPRERLSTNGHGMTVLNQEAGGDASDVAGAAVAKSFIPVGFCSPVSRPARASMVREHIFAALPNILMIANSEKFGRALLSTLLWHRTAVEILYIFISDFESENYAPLAFNFRRSRRTDLGEDARRQCRANLWNWSSAVNGTTEALHCKNGAYTLACELPQSCWDGSSAWGRIGVLTTENTQRPWVASNHREEGLGWTSSCNILCYL